MNQRQSELLFTTGGGSHIIIANNQTAPKAILIFWRYHGKANQKLVG
jgi:hypothetical protein